MSEPAAVPRPVTTTTSDQATIGKSLVIKGEVTGSESLYIGRPGGGFDHSSGNRVTIAAMALVAANISAREIVVLGKVRGNLTASDRVDIRSDGSLTGDVVAARISIEDGAFFKGGIDIRKTGKADSKLEEVKSVRVYRRNQRLRCGRRTGSGHFVFRLQLMKQFNVKGILIVLRMPFGSWPAKRLCRDAACRGFSPGECCRCQGGDVASHVSPGNLYRSARFEVGS